MIPEKAMREREALVTLARIDDFCGLLAHARALPDDVQARCVAAVAEQQIKRLREHLRRQMASRSL
jgi:hypothetical protein